MSLITHNNQAPLFYMFDDDHDMNVEFELELSGHDDSPFLVEASWVYYCTTPPDDEGIRYPKAGEVFEFRIYAYNELVQSYEIDVTDKLSDVENRVVNKAIYNEWLANMGE